MYVKPLCKGLECHYCSAMLFCFSVFQLFSSVTFYPHSLPSEWECIGIHLVDLPVVNLYTFVIQSPCTGGVQLNCRNADHYSPEARMHFSGIHDSLKGKVGLV